MNQPVAASSTSLTARLGWRAERRPEPGFAHTLGAAAAAFAVFAVFFVILEVTGDDATAPGVGFYLLLGIAAFLGGAQMGGPLRAAAVTALVFAVPLVWLFAFVGDGEGGSGTVRVLYILIILSYLALYLFTWTKGHAVLLGLALFLLVSWVVWEIDTSAGPAPFQDQISNISNRSDAPFDISGNNGAGEKTDETATAALVLGLLYLGAATALDRKKLAGIATPFIAVGGISTVVGSIVLVRDSSATAGGLTLAVSGAIVGLIGGLGTNRRFSTWFGVLLVVIGLSIVVGDNVHSNLGTAGVFAALAAAVAVGANFIAPKLEEFVDGDINAGTTSKSG
jgi:hypothetical protein